MSLALFRGRWRDLIDGQVNGITRRYGRSGRRH